MNALHADPDTYICRIMANVCVRIKDNIKLTLK